MQTIALELIRTDGGTQMRAELHKDTYLEYRDIWQSSSESFPPLVLFFDGSVYWLADGFHRFYGAREAGMKTVPADVREGTQRDAILYAVGANQSNGLRRTNMDKRRAVETLLNDAEWVAWSDRNIAEQVGVSDPFVSQIRKQLLTVSSSLASEQADKPRKGKDGKMRKPPKPKTNRKAGADVSNPESDATEPDDTATEPEPEDSETYPPKLCDAAKKAHKDGKLKANPAQLAALAELDDQEAIVASILGGRQSVENAIETGEVAPETIQEKIDKHNSMLESFCRRIQEILGEFPDDEWLRDSNRGGGALQKIKDALAMIRTAKCHKPCPKCEGGGCRECHRTGRMPKTEYDRARS